MALLEVLTFPNPVLRRKSEDIPQVTDELQVFAKDMLETMYSFNGIGLAAPQVGRLERMIVLDTRPREDGRYKPEDQTVLEQKIEQPLVLVNPKVVEKDGKVTYDEGCLSVPSYFETVERAKHIRVQALGIDGKEVEFEVDGLLSICIQHEIDHLDGKLFIDRLSPIKSQRIKSKIKKYGYPEKETEDVES